MQNLAVNLQTGSVTEFRNFSFLAVCVVAGIIYGVRSDGLYEISYEHTADDTDILASRFVTGCLTLNNNHQKRVAAVYYDQLEVPSAPLTAVIKFDDKPELKYAYAEKLAPGKGATGYSIAFGIEGTQPYTIYAITYLLSPLRRRGG